MSILAGLTASREVLLRKCAFTDTSIPYKALLDACTTGYRPHQIVALGAPDVEPSSVPLLQGRSQTLNLIGEPTAELTPPQTRNPQT